MNIMKKSFFRRLNSCFFLAFFLFFTQIASAQPSIAWSDWVAQLKEEAVSEGISPTLFDQAFAGMSGPSQKILGFLRSQPEHRLTYPQYLSTRAGGGKIPMGQREYQQYRQVLNSIEARYGVDPCVVVALWGMESSYGHFMGDFPSVQALATMAYASPRPEVFRPELLDALHMLNDHDVSFQEFKGEWAGASGQCQFLPSSWYKYAVDFDGNGRKDIWTSVPDVLASIANYIKDHGWQPGQPRVISVQLPPNFSSNYVQTREIKSLSDWAALGVRQASGEPLPNQNWNAFVIHPDGGPTWLALDNFRAILGYNNSIYYAGTIGYMADQICHRAAE
jgi:membrane-bound lytic murein transglycosylase B